MSEEARKRAQELALKRLARSEISAAEMQRYLRQKEIPDEVAESLVADYVARGYISDERYGAMVARSLLGRGKGPVAVRQKLMQKGVKLDRDELRDLVGAVEGFDEVEAAQQVLERRYPNIGKDRKGAARAFQALVRRGFSFEAARSAIERAKRG